MANIQPTVDALDEPTVMLQIRKIAGTVDSNLEAVNDEMVNIQEQINQMEDVSGRVTTLENEMDTVQSDLTAVENKNTEQDSAISENEKGLITASELTYSEGVLTLKLTKQNGDLTETVDVPFFKTVTLIPTSTERAFKLQFTMWDDSVYDTNEFVIPSGGGTDVSVAGVTIGEGASDNSFKVSIQLSDASTIASNDYPFPESVVNPYPTSATLALSGNTLNLTIGLSNSTNISGSVDLSPILASYATQAWVTGQLANYATNEDLEEIQVQITGLAITSSGNTMSINGTSATIINSISGNVSDSKLVVTVNGVNSNEINISSAVVGDAASITFDYFETEEEAYFYNRSEQATGKSGIDNEIKIFNNNKTSIAFNATIGSGSDVNFSYGTGDTSNVFFGENTINLKTSNIKVISPSNLTATITISCSNIALTGNDNVLNASYYGYTNFNGNITIKIVNGIVVSAVMNGTKTKVIIPGSGGTKTIKILPAGENLTVNIESNM